MGFEIVEYQTIRGAEGCYELILLRAPTGRLIRRWDGYPRSGFISDPRGRWGTARGAGSR
jgi:hypothetical protein